MATISDIVRAGHLEPYTLPEWETRMAIRSLWVTPGLLDDICEDLTLIDPKKGKAGLSVAEHFELQLCDFRCSEYAIVGDLRRMMPNRNGHWSMHSLGLRAYGWCPGQNQFVAITFAKETATKADKDLNDKKAAEVLAFIARHKLENTVLRGDKSVLFPKQG